MPELQRLRADHAGAVLDFERANRAYFAASISDRGDEYFARFAERHEALLADQEAGHGAFHVLVDDDGSVLGRFNLVFVADGVAELGYRVAERAAGRGVATSAVRALCDLAATRYGITTIRAATSVQNVASQRVLRKAGFVATGPADPAEVGGKQGTWFERDLGLPTIGGMEILAGAGRYVASSSSHWAEHLAVPDLSCGTYSLPAGGTDAQSPHTEDEIYVVTRGRATLWTPAGSAPMGPGDVAFVPAGEEHRFVDIVEEFAVVVVFGPAEGSRATEGRSSPIA